MIKTGKTKLTALFMVLLTLFTALFIPINAAEPDISENVGIEEIMPIVVNRYIYKDLPILFKEVGRWYPYTLTNGYTYSMAPGEFHDYQCVTIWDKNGNEVDLFYCWHAYCKFKKFWLLPD